MEALPLVLAAVVALVLTPAALSALREAGMERENYRGARLPFPAGWVIAAAAALALVPLAPLAEIADADVLAPELRTIAIYVLGVAVLGLLDDVVHTESRGWRGHGAEILGGAVSTGALKAAGSLGLALFALSGLGYESGEYLLAVGVLIIATNLFNLLDLRPGRSAKAFVLLGAGLTIGARDLDPLWALGLFAGPVLVVGLYDLRERTMLGDAGSNVIGALAGLWIVLALDTTGQLVALMVMIGFTVYGEFRSISELIEKAPLVRQLDSLGRLTHA